jgi:hypothetical protein
MNVSQNTTNAWERSLTIVTQPNPFPTPGRPIGPRVSSGGPMPVLVSLDRPAWDQLCALTTSWLLTAQSAAEEREIWALKLRCRKLYEASPDPEGISRRMLQILTRPAQRQQAA